MKNPKYCPNPQCRNHTEPGKPESPHKRWYLKSGTYSTSQNPTGQKFRCTACGAIFSEQTFSFDYYVKKQLDNELILKRIISGSSLRSIARDLGVSLSAIRNRAIRLSRRLAAKYSAINRTL